jgi:hypothetical protein
MIRQAWPSTIVDFREVLKCGAGAWFANLPVADAFWCDRA